MRGVSRLGIPCVARISTALRDAVIPGLCSVTFRALDVDAIARLAATCRLSGIEWGADVHVPPADVAAIARARAASSGLDYVSYGSYLLAADAGVTGDEVAIVLDAAVELGASHVRIWSPFGVEPGSPRAGEIVDRLRYVASEAFERRLTVGIEYHGGTLTATAASAAAIVDAVVAPNLSLYWQPPYWLGQREIADDVDDVATLGGRVSHLHVYEWTPAPDVERLPLAAGDARWRAVLAALEAPAVEPRVAFCEFVAGDDPAQLVADARTLHEWIGE